MKRLRNRRFKEIIAHLNTLPIIEHYDYHTSVSGCNEWTHDIEFNGYVVIFNWSVHQGKAIVTFYDFGIFNKDSDKEYKLTVDQKNELENTLTTFFLFNEDWEPEYLHAWNVGD